MLPEEPPLEVVKSSDQPQSSLLDLGEDIPYNDAEESKEEKKEEDSPSPKKKFGLMAPPKNT